MALIATTGCGGELITSAAEQRCETPEQYFLEQVWRPLLSRRCIECHNANGLARGTRMVLTPDDSPEALRANYAAVRRVARVSTEHGPLLVAKPTAKVAHTGGRRVAPDSEGARALDRMAKIIADPSVCAQGGSCQEPAPIEARLWRLTRDEYDRTVAALVGADLGLGRTLAAEAVVAGYRNNAAALRMSTLLAEQVMRAAGEIAQAVVDRLPRLAPCEAGADELACARAFAESFVSRAYRRPLAADEVERLVALFAAGREGGTYADGIRLMSEAVFQSPHFLYRTEIGEPAESGVLVQLGAHEIASAMSYALTGGPPDAQLTEAAAAGRLSSGEARREEAARLLADPAAAERFAVFVSQWLGIEQLRFVEKDPTAYPAFDERLRASMLAETEAMAEHVFTSEGSSLVELLTADYSFVDDALAELYGVDVGASGTPARLTLPEGQRRGVLTHASVLATYAHAHESSPVKRGKFVRENILCQPLPPPPPIDVLPPPASETLTTRERFASHSSDAACSVCHARIDPIGFGLERYDGVGRYRESENGQLIDASGELTETLASNGAFNDGVELVDRLAASVEVRECFVGNYLRFSLGRGERAADGCFIEQLASDFERHGTDIRAMILDSIALPHFIVRVRPGEP